MRKLLRAGSFAAAFLLVALGNGCAGPLASASFDRTLAVNGPVLLEVTNDSGATNISTGAIGEVQIRAEVHIHALPWENAGQRTADLARNPPIEQNGNVIRIGSDSERLRLAEVDYTVVVPVETALHARIGSGTLTVSGIRGPATLASGSGDIAARDIGDDAEVTTGSGDIQLSDLKGDARVSTGSGDVKLTDVAGAARLSTGSGDILIERAGGAVTAKTGSGDVQIKGVSGDLRISTSSGDISIAADPKTNYWELHTGSGDASLHVPPNVNFRLHASTRSGDINSSLPLVVEERSSRGHEIRAHLGQGGGRVEVGTSSGDIQLQ
jgi:DUF4097 and DUF4098 domain-containing protein YvlB